MRYSFRKSALLLPKQFYTVQVQVSNGICHYYSYKLAFTLVEKLLFCE
jgi:hypothetical protein